MISLRKRNDIQALSSRQMVRGHGKNKTLGSWITQELVRSQDTRRRKAPELEEWQEEQEQVDVYIYIGGLGGWP